MPYTAEISRANPSCFLFLIDQSASMSDSFGGQAGKTKAEGVADAVNRLLQNLVIKCAKAEGVRDYFHVGVIGYGNRVGPALSGALAGHNLVPISEIAHHPLRVEKRTKKVDDGAGGLVDQPVKFPVWFEPVADGSTPMCQALNLAQEILADFIGRTPACFPPIVINITDGEATDGDPSPVAGGVSCLNTQDGNVLIFNIHLSSRNEQPIELPNDDVTLPDTYARQLFHMSSFLPPRMQEIARNEGYPANTATRGFVFNADLIAVIRFLDIGTRVSQNLR
jgi:hypothetical protein